VEQEKIKPSKIINSIFTPNQLVSKQDDNSIAFSQKYENVAFKVRGRVLNFMDASNPYLKARFFIGEDSNEIFIQPYMVVCVVDNPNQIANLTRGDVVTIQGMYEKNSISQLLVLRKCRVIGKS
jgi:hypothetical protein